MSVSGRKRLVTHSSVHLFTHSLTYFFVHSFIRSLFDSVCGAVDRPVSREGCVVDGEQATCPQELTACPGACRGRGPLSWRVASGLPGDPGQWSLSSFQGACAVGPRACILFSSHWSLRASTHGKALFFKHFSQTPLLGVSHLIVKFSGSKIQFPKNRVDKKKHVVLSQGWLAADECPVASASTRAFPPCQGISEAAAILPCLSGKHDCKEMPAIVFGKCSGNFYSSVKDTYLLFEHVFTSLFSK